MNLTFVTEPDLAAISDFPEQCAEKLVAALACLQSLQHDVESKGRYVEHWETKVVSDVFFAWHALANQCFQLLYEVRSYCEKTSSIRVDFPNDFELPSRKVNS